MSFGDRGYATGGVVSAPYRLEKEALLGELPGEAIMSKVRTEAFAAKARRDEAIVRELLGGWVSELEPVLVLDRRGEILGLTFAGIPVGAMGPAVFGLQRRVHP